MAWLMMLLMAVLFSNLLFLSYNNQVRGSPIEVTFTSSHDLAVSSLSIPSRGLKVKRGGEEDLANVYDDTNDNTNIDVYAVISIDLETGEWRKTHFSFMDYDVAMKTWRDFPGIREESDQDWLTFSQHLWNSIPRYTITGFTYVKNVAAFELHSCTAVLLANDRFAVLGHFRDGWGNQADDSHPTGSIETVGRLQIEFFNDVAMKNKEKLTGARLYASRLIRRSAGQKWSEFLRFFARPTGIRFRDITWFTHGSPWVNGKPTMKPHENDGGKLLLNGKRNRIYTQPYTGGPIQRTLVETARAPVARLPVEEAAPVARERLPAAKPAVVRRPGFRLGRGRFWKF